MVGSVVTGQEGLASGRRLGAVLLGLLLLGLAAGRVHAQSALPVSAPVLTAAGGHGPWPAGPAHTGAEIPGAGEDGLRAALLLVWPTDEADCGGGVLHGRTQAVVAALVYLESRSLTRLLHGRTQAVVAALETETGLACAAIGPAQLAAVTALDLRSRGLTQLRAGDLAGLSALQRLDLSGNRLEKLPAGLLAGLSALQHLDLSGNWLDTWPTGLFAGLSSLQHLDLSGNRLEKLPAAILLDLPSLQRLDLSWNWLRRDLSTEVLARLPSLQHLDLSWNMLYQEAWSADVRVRLPALQTLDLAGNGLDEVPTGLPALQRLDLSHNGLQALPAELLAGLPALQHLDLRGNELAALPAELVTELAALPSLDLSWNWLPALPAELAAGAAAGRVHFRPREPAPVPTAAGLYTHRAEHLEGRWHLARRGRQVTATLTVVRGAGRLPAAQGREVLFRMPTGFRPERWRIPWGKVWPVDGAGQALGTPVRRQLLEVGPDGTVRFRETPFEEGQHYELTLSWSTEEAACDGGVLHGRSQGVVDVLEAQMGLACAAIGPAQLAAVTALDLRGRELHRLRAGDLAGLESLQRLNLSRNQLYLGTLPSQLGHLPSLQRLDLSWNRLFALPAGFLSDLPSLQHLDLRGNRLSALPAGFLSDLPSLRHLDLSWNRLHFPGSLPADVLADLPALQRLDLSYNALPALPTGLLRGLDALQTLDLSHNRLAALPAGLAAGLTAGRVHFRPPGPPHPASVPALTAQGTYAHPTTHWAGRWQLVRRGRQVTAMLAPARASGPAPAVLFQVPPGFRPARPVAQTVALAPAQRVTLEVARDGTVRAGVEGVGTGEGWARYRSTLVWLTDEADCGGGVLHGRTQEVVDALAAQTGLACAAIGPAQLAAVTTLDLHGSALPGLRAGDLAGLVSLQRLDLSDRGLTALPAGLFAGLEALQRLDLSGNRLTALPDGLPALPHLALDGNPLAPAILASVQGPGGSAWREDAVRPVPVPALRALEYRIETPLLPAWLVAELTQAQSLTLAVRNLHGLPPGFLAQAPQLQHLTLRAGDLPALPEGFLADAPQLRTLELYLPYLQTWPQELLTEGHARLERVTLHLTRPGGWEGQDLVLPPHLLAQMPRLAQVELRGGPRAWPAGLLAQTPSLRTLVLPSTLEALGPGTLAQTGLGAFALRTEAAPRGPGAGAPAGLTLGAGFLAGAAQLRTFSLRTGRGLDALHLPPGFLADLPHLAAVRLDAPLPRPLPAGFLRGAQLQALQLRLPAAAPLPALVQAQHLTLDLPCDTASPPALVQAWPHQEWPSLRACPASGSADPDRP